MKSTQMKLLQSAALVTAFSAATLALAQTPAPAAPAASSAPATPVPSPVADDRTSYLFGLSYGAQMRNAGITTQVSVDAIQRGIKDGLSGIEPTQDDGRQLQSFVTSVQKAATANNNAAAASFLAKNGKEKGVITTASGVEYKVLVAGDKKAPLIGSSDEVTVNYRGKLLDGSEFDSSYSRNKPQSFPVNGVIKGWQEALVLMRPGTKFQLWVPPALAYGDVSRPKIPGGSLLVFDVDVISAVNPAAAAAAPPTAPPGSPNSTH
jgi:FKBP-type peptidyl-prolyl cis-trans isomerase FklB